MKAAAKHVTKHVKFRWKTTTNSMAARLRAARTLLNLGFSNKAMLGYALLLKRSRKTSGASRANSRRTASSQKNSVPNPDDRDPTERGVFNEVHVVSEPEDESSRHFELTTASVQQVLEQSDHDVVSKREPNSGEHYTESLTSIQLQSGPELDSDPGFDDLESRLNALRYGNWESESDSGEHYMESLTSIQLQPDPELDSDSDHHRLQQDLFRALELENLPAEDREQIMDILQYLQEQSGTKEPLSMEVAQSYLESVYDRYVNEQSRAPEGTTPEMEREELKKNLMLALDIDSFPVEDRMQIGSLLEQLEAGPDARNAVSTDVAQSYLESVYDRHVNGQSGASEGTAPDTDREELKKNLILALDIDTLSLEDRRQIGSIIEQLEARPGTRNAVSTDVAQSYLESIYDTYFNAPGRARSETEQEGDQPPLQNVSDSEADYESSDEEEQPLLRQRRQPERSADQ